MRTIKFRAWDTTTHEYRGQSNLLVGLDGWLHWEFGYETRTVEKDVYVLEQFTGLKDKNGKEIYEGDIVKYHLFAFSGTWIGGDWIVRFGEGDTQDIESGDCFIGFYLELLNAAKPKEQYRKTEHRTISGINDMLEVIGNIHESPELLK